MLDVTKEKGKGELRGEGDVLDFGGRARWGVGTGVWGFGGREKGRHPRGVGEKGKGEKG